MSHKGILQVRRRSRHGVTFVMSTADENQKDKQPTRAETVANQGPFGIRLQTNGDVLKFGVIAILLGYGVKYLLQTVFRLEDLAAGQWTTGILSVTTLIAWISTYVFRVGTKSMTYAQQLKEYEDAVIEKRYNELTEEELAALSQELEEDK